MEVPIPVAARLHRALPEAERIETDNLGEHTGKGLIAGLRLRYI